MTSTPSGAAARTRRAALVAPAIHAFAEHANCADLVTTYGKTFHTWQYDRGDFPYEYRS
jgi:hypothetical protein